MHLIFILVNMKKKISVSIYFSDSASTRTAWRTSTHPRMSACFRTLRTD